MTVPSPRTPIRLARGAHQELINDLMNLAEGEIVWAIDEGRLYVAETMADGRRKLAPALTSEGEVRFKGVTDGTAAAAGGAENGDIWINDVAGTAHSSYGPGITGLIAVGDYLVFDGTRWKRIGNISGGGPMSAAEKRKLDGVAAGAEVNVQADWAEADALSDAFIANKPTSFPPPVATATTIGGVKPGAGLAVEPDGTIRVLLTGGLSYKGTVSASAAAPATPVAGDVYLIGTGGNFHPSWGIAGSGAVGEMLVFENGIWDAVGHVAAPIKPNWNAAAGAIDEILNKPAVPPLYVLPRASASSLGGIKIGSGLRIAPDGTVSTENTGALAFKGNTAPTSVAPAAPVSGDVWVMSSAGVLDASWAGVAGTTVAMHELIVYDGAEWDRMGSIASVSVSSIAASAPLFAGGTSTAPTIGIAMASRVQSGAMSAADKAKLESISNGAEVNVQADWTEVDPASDAFIAHKPATFTPPVATATSIGGVKAGTGLAIDPDGTIRVNLTGGLRYKGTIAPTDSAPAGAVDGDVYLVGSAGLYHASWGLRGGAEVGEMLVHEGGVWDAVGHVTAPVKVDWNAAAGAANEILNKPAIPRGYTLPVASSAVLGGIKVGAGLQMRSDGTLVSAVTGALVFKGSSEPNVVAPTSPSAGDVWVMRSAGTLHATWAGSGGLKVTQHELVAFDGAEWTVMGAVGGIGTHPDWAETNPASENFIRNKPATFNPPVATATVLGGVKAGTGVTIAADGTLRVSLTGGLRYRGTIAAGDPPPVGPVDGDVYLIGTGGPYHPGWHVTGTAVVGEMLVFEGGAWDAVGHVTTPLKPDWNAAAGATNEILNKPAIPAAYTLPKATNTTLGGVKVGNGLVVGSDGTLSASLGNALVFKGVMAPTGSAPLNPVAGDVWVMSAAGVLHTSWTGVAGIDVPLHELVAYDGTEWDLMGPGSGGGVHPDWAVTDPASPAFIKNKPATWALPVASSTVLGGVKAGTGVSIDADGTLRVALSGGLFYKGTVAPTAPAPASPANGDVYLLGSAGAYHPSWKLPGSGSVGEMLVFEGGSWDAVGHVAAPIKPDWNAAAGAANEILNKPVIPSALHNDPATTTSLGVVKVGSGLRVQSDGTLSSVMTGALVFRGSKDPFELAPTAPVQGDVWVMKSEGALHATWAGIGGQHVVLHELVAYDGAEWTVMGVTTEAYHGVQTGTVQWFAGGSAPVGWLVCDGSLIEKARYPLLAGVLGTLYGPGDATHVQLPDLRGEWIRGVDLGRNVGSGALGSRGDGAVASHTHTATVAVADAAGTAGSAVATSSGGSHSHSASANSGGDHSHGGSTDSSGGHTHGVSDPGHSHGVGDPGHSHSYRRKQSGKGGGTTGGDSNISTDQTGTTATGIQIHGSGCNISIQGGGGHSHNLNISSGGGHGHGVSVTAGGDHTHTVSVSVPAHGHTATATVAAAGTESKVRSVHMLPIIKT